MAKIFFWPEVLQLSTGTKGSNAEAIEKPTELQVLNNNNLIHTELFTARLQSGLHDFQRDYNIINKAIKF